MIELPLVPRALDLKVERATNGIKDSMITLFN